MNKSSFKFRLLLFRIMLKLNMHTNCPKCLKIYMKYHEKECNLSMFYSADNLIVCPK